MEIGHSTLLKFFVKHKPKMEKHTLKIEDLTPSAIESEVPRQQKVREATTVPSFEETKTPKSVQNVGQIEWVDLRDMIKKPVNMGLQEEVILSPHLIRPPRVEEGPPRVGEGPPRVGEGPPINETETPEVNKPQTRIPVSRFKPVAERVLKERKDTTDAERLKVKREAPEKPRRTSIPKLKDRKTSAINTLDENQHVKKESTATKEADEKPSVKTSLKRATRNDKIPVLSKDHYKITKRIDGEKKEKQDENKDKNKDTSAVKNQGEPVKSESIEKLDDEFDKLYDEIVDTDAVSPAEDILEIKVKDPEKLETKFEEIVHQYDDPPIEQVEIEPVDKARYSKIPLLRRRSSHDVNVTGLIERKLSLKTGIINKSSPANDHKANNSKIKNNDNVNQNHVTKDRVEGFADTEKDNAEVTAQINNNDQNDCYIELQSPDPVPVYNTIATPDSELVKVGILGITTRDIPIEEPNQNVATPELETVKAAVIDKPTEEPNKNIEDETTETKPVPKLQEDTNVLTVDNNKVVTKPIGINIYNKDENVINKEGSINGDPVDSPINHIIPEHNILIHKPDNELKSYNLLKNTKNIESLTTKNVNKPPKEEAKENNKPKLEEDFPVKGKVGNILRKLTLQENPKNHFSDNKEKEDINKELDDTPKKKSVLSKIAMFERGEPEAPSSRKTTRTYQKPIRTISEDLKHSPKIVQEVLKPKVADTDKHTIVTIDIARPVDVITTNEEQITVVENLKEETVTYDNFDDARRKTDTKSKTPTTHEIGPSNSLHTDKNTIVEIELTKPVEVVTNEEQVTVVENLKENIVTYDDFDNDRLKNTKVIEIEPKNNVDDINTNNYNKLKHVNNYNNTDKEKQIKEKWKSTDALSEFLPVKEKINRLKSFEDTNLKKAKSTAELDLGDAVKGKVKNMIVRMNSSELLDDVKPKAEVISAKERPRKRSVSEKIALFERKLTPVTMDNVKVEASPRALHSHSKPVPNSVNAIPAVKETVSPPGNVSNEVSAKIKELTKAKLTYGSVSNMSYMQLKDGRKMPVLALGTALLEPSLASHIVSAAIDLGFRAIDTAFIYGNEKEVGEGIRAKIQDGTVRREDLFIMNKMWSTFHRPDLVEVACRASLAATGLDYFDLYMIHNPMSFKEGGDPIPKIANVLQFSEFDYLDAWFAVEQLVTKGLVRSVGVSNFNSVQLTRVLEKGRIKPVVNQVECHPYLNQKNLTDFCDAREVRMSCFGVLGSKGTPADLKASQAAAIDDPLVQVMSAGLGISPAQLLIRYQIESGRAVVVKCSSPAHMWDVLSALNVTLGTAEVDALHALNKNKRTFTFAGMGDTHKNYPFKIAF